MREIDAPGIKLKVDLSIAANTNSSAPANIGNGGIKISLPNDIEAGLNGEREWTTGPKIEVDGFNAESGIGFGQTVQFS